MAEIYGDREAQVVFLVDSMTHCLPFLDSQVELALLLLFLGIRARLESRRARDPSSQSHDPVGMGNYRAPNSNGPQPQEATTPFASSLP